MQRAVGSVAPPASTAADTMRVCSAVCLGMNPDDVGDDEPFSCPRCRYSNYRVSRLPAAEEPITTQTMEQRLRFLSDMFNVLIGMLHERDGCVAAWTPCCTACCCFSQFPSPASLPLQ